MIYIICGMPGVGKTTYAKKIEQETGAVRFTLDNWVHQTYGDEHHIDLGIREHAVKYQVLERIEELLRAGKSVILDYGFFKEAERRRYRLLAQDYKTNSEVHFVTTSYDNQLERVLTRNNEPGNVHHIDKDILDSLIMLFEKPQDRDVVTINT